MQSIDDGTTVKKSNHKLFAYPGGKTPVRNEIVAIFPPRKDIDTYADVFGGSAVMTLGVDPYPGQVFNDKNEMLINFFRVVKHRPAELAERAKNWIHSRTLWKEMRFSTTMPADEVERAFLFWTRLQDSFGARGMNFGTSRGNVHSVTKARNYLDEVSKRLENVHIECLPFDKCIKSYDSPKTFFYFDPPYRDTTGGESNYNQLSTEEWQLLRDLAGSMQGKFLLSHTDDPVIVKLFKGFNIKKIKVRVTLAKTNNAASRTEVLISNYPFPRVKKHVPVYAADRPTIKRSSKKIVRKELAK